MSVQSNPTPNTRLLSDSGGADVEVNPIGKALFELCNIFAEAENNDVQF